MRKSSVLAVKMILMAIVVSMSAFSASAENVMSLDSCRSMALRNNKSMRIAKEKQAGAAYQRKEARAAYLLL